MSTVIYKRLLWVYTLLLCVSLNLYSQTTNSKYQQYIEQYRDIAIEQMIRWRIPASITLAQGLLESAAGQSTLATAGNNHFGIKCHGWQGRTIRRNDDAPNECFRAYNTVYESFEDHSRFLATGQRYRSLFQLRITDYEGWARGLKAAGYATSPTYAQSLIDIIRNYNLSQYDRARSYDHFVVDHARDANTEGMLQHAIFKYNKNYYVYARRGDTFRSLASEMGVSYRRLARYNERNKNDVLEEGEIIWLEKKRSKGPKEVKNQPHCVQVGDSMYTIAQKYGIRLKSLYKLNHLSPDYHIQVGDIIRLR
jgi:LysM repeat protein